ncbi:hypothetical protein Tco_0494688 [Tanacetum coccineum]
MSSNRPKRTVKPLSRYENYVYSNSTVKNMSSSNNKGSECEKVVTSKENTKELVVNGKCKESQTENRRQATEGEHGRNLDGEIKVEVDGSINQGSKDSEKTFGNSLKKGPVSDENAKRNANGVSNDNKYRSYAGITGNNFSEVDKKLKEIPTELDDNGNEFVVFDEVLVAEGSKK